MKKSYLFIQPVLDAFNAFDDIDSREFVGCSEAEMAAIEAIHPAQRRIPGAVREYFLFAGHQLAFLSDVGSMMKCNYLASPIKGRGFPNQTHVGPEVFIFSTIQEAGFAAYVRFDEGEDPPVYYNYHNEGKDQLTFVRTADRFTQWLLVLVEGHLRFEEQELQHKQRPLLRAAVNAYKKAALDLADQIKQITIEREDFSTFSKERLEEMDIYSLKDYLKEINWDVLKYVYRSSAFYKGRDYDGLHTDQCKKALNSAKFNLERLRLADSDKATFVERVSALEGLVDQIADAYQKEPLPRKDSDPDENGAVPE